MEQSAIDGDPVGAASLLDGDHGQFIRPTSNSAHSPPFPGLPESCPASSSPLVVVLSAASGHGSVAGWQSSAIASTEAEEMLRQSRPRRRHPCHVTLSVATKMTSPLAIFGAMRPACCSGGPGVVSQGVFPSYDPARPDGRWWDMLWSADDRAVIAHALIYPDPDPGFERIRRVALTLVVLAVGLFVVFGFAAMNQPIT